MRIVRLNPRYKPTGIRIYSEYVMATLSLVKENVKHTILHIWVFYIESILICVTFVLLHLFRFPISGPPEGWLICHVVYLRYLYINKKNIPLLHMFI